MRTKKCHGCKESFIRNELVDYSSPNAKTIYSYCKKCYKEKLARDMFSENICMIFGIKTPGPQIWTERKRIQEKYGYSDDTIIDCLKYVYEVKKLKKLSNSLYLVTPMNVDQMLRYKKIQNFKATQIADAAGIKIEEHMVNIKENIQSNKTDWNPDDWL